MRLALVLLAGCSAPRAPSIGNTAPVAPPAVMDVPIEPTSFHYCCKGGGTIERSISLTAGHWLMRVGQHSDECYEAIHPVVTTGTGERLSTGVASTPAWAATLVDVPAAFGDQPLRMRIFVEGGLRCCGTTTIDRIQLVRL